MSAIAVFGAALMFALTNVIAGMMPVNFTGDAQVAIWLISLLVALATYVTLKREMAAIGH